MNLSEHEMERLLRSAPRPTPPRDLRDRLIADIPRGPARSASSHTVSVPGFWRRWWPALAPAALSVACGVVMALQHLEIRDTRDTLQALAPPGNAQPGTTAAVVPAVPTAQPVAPATLQVTPEQEIAQLKTAASELNAEVSRLEKLQTENGALRQQLAAQQSPLTPAEQAQMNDAMQKAREKAQLIQCINNMKQIGLAARVWAIDHSEVYPPELASASNELSTPKILVCPGDTNRAVAVDWNSFSAANNSYEYLAPGGSPEEPTRLLSRCPIHGNIGMCDGSVMQRVAKDHPEQIIQREGKLYFLPSTPSLTK